MLTATIRKGFDGLSVHTPYLREYVDALKAVLPAHHRKWDRSQMVWVVHPKSIRPLIFILKSYFNKVVVDEGIKDYSCAYDYESKYFDWYTQYNDSANREQREREEGQQKQHNNNRYSSTGHDPGYDLLCVNHDAPSFIITAAWKAWNKHLRQDNELGCDKLKDINAAYDRLKDQAF